MKVHEIRCAGCNETYRIDLTKFGGKKIRCKACDKGISVPSAVETLDEFEVVEEKAPLIDTKQHSSGFPKPSHLRSSLPNVLSDLFKPGLRNQLILSGGVTLLLGIFSLTLLIASLLIPPLRIPFFICLWFAGLAFLFFGISGVTFLKQKEFLIGLWNPVDESAVPIQFMQNGRVVRLDGVTGHYEFAPLQERLTIRLPDVPGVTLEVVSITKHELHLSDGGTLQQYTKGETLSEAELRKEMEAMKQRLVAVGKAAAVVSGVALAGLAVLGVAAAGAGGTSSGRNTGLARGTRACPGCGQGYNSLAELHSDRCLNCGTKLNFN